MSTTKSWKCTPATEGGAGYLVPPEMSMDFDNGPTKLAGRRKRTGCRSSRQSNPNRPGFCYLRLFAIRARKLVAKVLGSNPKVDGLVRLLEARARSSSSFALCRLAVQPGLRGHGTSSYLQVHVRYVPHGRHMAPAVSRSLRLLASSYLHVRVGMESPMEKSGPMGKASRVDSMVWRRVGGPQDVACFSKNIARRIASLEESKAGLVRAMQIRQGSKKAKDALAQADAALDLARRTKIERGVWTQLAGPPPTKAEDVREDREMFADRYRDWAIECQSRWLDALREVASRNNRLGDETEAIARQGRHALEFYFQQVRGRPMLDSSPIACYEIVSRMDPTKFVRLPKGWNESARPWTSDELEKWQVWHIAKQRKCSPEEAAQIREDTMDSSLRRWLGKTTSLLREAKRDGMVGFEARQVPDMGNGDGSWWEFAKNGTKSFLRHFGGSDTTNREGTIEKNPGPKRCGEKCLHTPCGKTCCFVYSKGDKKGQKASPTPKNKDAAAKAKEKRDQKRKANHEHICSMCMSGFCRCFQESDEEVSPDGQSEQSGAELVSTRCTTPELGSGSPSKPASIAMDRMCPTCFSDWCVCGQDATTQKPKTEVPSWGNSLCQECFGSEGFCSCTTRANPRRGGLGFVSAGFCKHHYPTADGLCPACLVEKEQEKEKERKSQRTLDEERKHTSVVDEMAKAREEAFAKKAQTEMVAMAMSGDLEPELLARLRTAMPDYSGNDGAFLLFLSKTNPQIVSATRATIASEKSERQRIEAEERSEQRRIESEKRIAAQRLEAEKRMAEARAQERREQNEHIEKLAEAKRLLAKAEADAKEKRQKLQERCTIQVQQVYLVPTTSEMRDGDKLSVGWTRSTRDRDSSTKGTGNSDEKFAGLEVGMVPTFFGLGGGIRSGWKKGTSATERATEEKMQELGLRSGLSREYVLREVLPHGIVATVPMAETFELSRSDAQRLSHHKGAQVVSYLGRLYYLSSGAKSCVESYARRMQELETIPNYPSGAWEVVRDLSGPRSRLAAMRSTSLATLRAEVEEMEKQEKMYEKEKKKLESLVLEQNTTILSLRQSLEKTEKEKQKAVEDAATSKTSILSTRQELEKKMSEKEKEKESLALRLASKSTEFDSDVAKAREESASLRAQIAGVGGIQHAGYCARLVDTHVLPWYRKYKHEWVGKPHEVSDLVESIRSAK